MGQLFALSTSWEEKIIGLGHGKRSFLSPHGSQLLTPSCSVGAKVKVPGEFGTFAGSHFVAFEPLLRALRNEVRFFPFLGSFWERCYALLGWG